MGRRGRGNKKKVSDSRSSSSNDSAKVDNMDSHTDNSQELNISEISQSTINSSMINSSQYISLVESSIASSQVAPSEIIASTFEGTSSSDLGILPSLTFEGSQKISQLSYQLDFPTLPDPSLGSINYLRSLSNPMYSCTDELMEDEQTGAPKRQRSRNNSDDSISFTGFEEPSNKRVTTHKSIDNLITAPSGVISDSVHLNISPSENLIQKQKEKEIIAEIPSTTNAVIRDSNILTDEILKETEGEDNFSKNRHENNVVLIKPDDYAINNGFFSNRLKIFRLIQQSLFKEAGIIECKPNMQRNILVVKIKDQFKIDKLLDIKQLGNYNVKCCLPMSQQYKIGLIGPIEFDVEACDIVELLSEEGFTNVKVERFVIGGKKNGKVTKSMKVWFEQSQFPKFITLMFQRYVVTPYIEQSLQCFKCQKLGHIAKYCKGRVVCLVCSGPHKHTECTVKDDCTKQKCANCGGEHTANYRGCPKLLKEKLIQVTRVKENLSYRDAIAAVQQNKTNSSTIIRTTNQKNINSTEGVSRQIDKKTISTQTAQDRGTDTMCSNTSNINNLSLEKIAICIFEIIHSSLKADTIGKKCNAVISAFANHLGIRIDKNVLLNTTKNQSKTSESQSQIIKAKSVHTVKHGPKKS